MQQKPQTISADLLAEMIALDQRNDNPSEMALAKLRREIEKVRTEEVDAYHALLAAWHALRFDLSETLSHARSALNLTFNPTIASNAVLSVQKSGNLAEAMNLSELSLRKFPGAPSILRAEEIVCFEGGRLTRGLLAEQSLERMNIPVRDLPFKKVLEILESRQHSEEELSALLISVRLFFSSVRRKVCGFSVKRISEYDRIGDFVVYAFYLGRTLEECLKFEDEVFQHLDTLNLPIYRDGTVLISLTARKPTGHTKDEHRTEEAH